MDAPIDLDHNATTRPLPEVVDAVHRASLELWHNPSSVHRAGQAVRHALEIARAELASLAGVAPRELILTGGGTEAIDLAVRGVLAARRKPVLITDDLEHAAVRDLAAALASEEGVSVERIPLEPGGRVGVDGLRRVLERVGPGAGLVSVQWANNETGVVQPIAAVYEACREARVPLHCDATQWIGKEPVNAGPAGPPADLMSFSPHKFHGPKGVGCLWVRRGVPLRPRLHGAQELGRRGGTENVAGIVGAGVAARLAASWLADPAHRAHLAARRDRFEAAVLARCPGAVVNGAGQRLWNTSNIGFPRLEAEALVMLLSERRVWVSAGAACSSGSLDPSPVLLAMGVPAEIAHGSVRFSLGRDTTDEQVDRAAEIVAECVGRLGATLPG